MINQSKMLILIASFFAITQLSAQDKFSLGPRAGLNFSSISNVDNSKSLTGLAVGLTTTYSINETSGITVDLLYSGQGYKVGIDEYKITYLQIPIYFDLFFGELGQSFRPKAYVGLAPHVLLNAKYNEDKVSKDQLSAVNLALSGGLGFNLRVVNRVWLNTDLRAFLGLSDYRDKEFQTENKRAMSTVQFSLGLAYGISKYE
ncbi:MAG TPA: outer membrane beta-barrel protein [Saprospiraceae bacterium]|nr:outer membrane beta-barrel protein [Saprospiraceae bacterium]